MTKIDSKFIPIQEFEVGDIITLSSDLGEDPLFRLITEVRVYVPELDEDDPDDPDFPGGRSPQRFYTWEYLDRGIKHLQQYREGEDYISENSLDPQLTLWRRVLKGASRP